MAPRPGSESGSQRHDACLPLQVKVNPIYPNMTDGGAGAALPANLWPMSLGTYLYVRTDLTYLGAVGAWGQWLVARVVLAAVVECPRLCVQVPCQAALGLQANAADESPQPGWSRGPKARLA